MFTKFFSENRAVYDIMSKNVVEPDRTQMAIWRRVACWISKVTRAQAQARAHEPPPTQTCIRARTRARTHARTHAHKHRHM